MFGLNQAVLREIDAVMNCAQTRHRLLPALEVADAHIIHIGIMRVEFAQFRIVSAVKRANHGGVNKTRACQTLRRLQMNRSEERRVGKECRSRWWAYHQK